MKIELDLPRESYYLPVLEKIFPLDGAKLHEVVNATNEIVDEKKLKNEIKKEPVEDQDSSEKEEQKKKDFDKQVVKDLFIELARNKKHSIAKEILESYGAQKVSNLIDKLDYDTYQAVCERCREVLNDA